MNDAEATIDIDMSTLRNLAAVAKSASAAYKAAYDAVMVAIDYRDACEVRMIEAHDKYHAYTNRLIK